MRTLFTTILLILIFTNNSLAQNIYSNEFKINKNEFLKLSYDYKYETISINESTERKENIIESYSKKIPTWMKVTGTLIAVSGAIAIASFRKNDLNLNNLKQNSFLNNSNNENAFSIKGKGNKNFNLEFKF